MKKLLLLLIALSGYARLATAQETISHNIVRSPGPLTDRIFIDSIGNVVPVDKWRELLSGGHYRTKTIIGTDTVKLIKLTDKEFEEKEASAPLPFASPSFPVGAKMEMFAAKDINGKKIDPKALAGKVVILNFWFITCSPCKAEMPALNKLAADYSSNPDVVFIAVGLDERWEIKNFLKTMPFNYTQIASGRSYADGLSVKSYPTNVVIDKQGIIRYSSEGFGPGYAYHLKDAVANCIK